MDATPIIDRVVLPKFRMQAYKALRAWTLGPQVSTKKVVSELTHNTT
jgi:hypothetical protein